MMIYDLIIDSTSFTLNLLFFPSPWFRKFKTAAPNHQPTGGPKDESKYGAACGDYDQ
jgi:hypothetical protein